MESRKSKLLFDHVPKTGGQSIAVALGEAFGEDGRLPDVSNAHRQVVANADARRFVAGHLWFVPGEPLRPDWFYCTVLRDPIDRFLSQYYFNREIARVLRAEAPDDRRLLDPQVAAAEKFDLAEYVTRHEHEIALSYRNVQAMHFAQRICPDPQALPDDALVHAAIRALGEYDLIGFYTDLQSFTDEVCRQFSLPRIEVPFVNVTSSRRHAHEVPAKLLRHLQQANEADLQLVEWARDALAGPKPRGTSASTRALAAAADFGTREIELRAARCLGPHADPDVHPGDPVRLVLECVARIDEPDLTIGMAVCDERGQALLGTNTKLIPGVSALPVKGQFRASFVFTANLPPGDYSVTVALHKGLTHTSGCYHWKDKAAWFSVKPPMQEHPPWRVGFELLHG